MGRQGGEGRREQNPGRKPWLPQGQIKLGWKDFPGGPAVVSVLPLPGGINSIPGWETNLQHA